MLFRLIIMAAVGWFIYTLFRRLTGAGRKSASRSAPFSRPQRKKRFDGTAVDADYEELDDEKGDA